MKESMTKLGCVEPHYLRLCTWPLLKVTGILPSSMAELPLVRAEIKAWERSFKAEHGRPATVDDIRQNNVIGALNLLNGDDIY